MVRRRSREDGFGADRGQFRVVDQDFVARKLFCQVSMAGNGKSRPALAWTSYSSGGTRFWTHGSIVRGRGSLARFLAIDFFAPPTGFRLLYTDSGCPNDSRTNASETALALARRTGCDDCRVFLGAVLTRDRLNVHIATAERVPLESTISTNGRLSQRRTTRFTANFDHRQSGGCAAGRPGGGRQTTDGIGRCGCPGFAGRG